MGERAEERSESKVPVEAMGIGLGEDGHGMDGGDLNLRGGGGNG